MNINEDSPALFSHSFIVQDAGMLLTALSRQLLASIANTASTANFTLECLLAQLDNLANFVRLPFHPFPFLLYFYCCYALSTVVQLKYFSYLCLQEMLPCVLPRIYLHLFYNVLYVLFGKMLSYNMILGYCRHILG